MDTDTVQTEAAIAQIDATLPLLDPTSAAAQELMDKRATLVELITPTPEAPPMAGDDPDLLPPVTRRDKNGNLFRVFYYLGGWYAAPPQNHPHWDAFVAAVGQAVANDSTIRNAVPPAGGE